MLLFYFGIFNFCFSSFILHFEREYNKENKSMDEYFSNRIYTNVSIGNPPQTIKTYINLKEFATFFSGNQTNIKFNPNISNSFNSDYKLRYSYSSYFSYGYISYDTFIFNINKKEKNIINNFTFFLAMLGNLNEKIKYPGLIGLRIYDENYNPIYPNFIHELKEKKIISSCTLTIKYNNENEGNIILDEKFPIYEKKGEFNFEFTRAEYNFYEYRIILENFTFMNISISKDIIVELDLHINNIVGSTQMRDLLKEQFFDDLINKNICKEQLYNNIRMLYFSCNNSIDISKFKTMYFKFNGLNKIFELNYHDLFKQFDDSYIFLMTFDSKIPYKLCLGVPFLKKYQFVFDQDKKVIGYFKNLQEDNVFPISYVLIIILGIILLFLCVIYFKIIHRNNRKIRYNEIEENFDYIPS